jgi:hypothetical protein
MPEDLEQNLAGQVKELQVLTLLASVFFAIPHTIDVVVKLQDGIAMAYIVMQIMH